MKAPPLPELLPLRYRFERFLSRRENAATVLVFDTGLRRSSAVIKCRWLSSVENGHEQAGSFLAFGAQLQDIQHAHLGAPYTYGILRGPGEDLYGYTTRAFVPGVSLASLARPLEDAPIVYAAAQISQGLTALHDKGLLHGDLKAENVVVRRSTGGKLDDLSQCVIIDLSYRPVAGDAPTSLSDVSLQYVAPELTAGAPADARSDLFSLGVLLYDLATGHMPFDGASVADILQAQRERAYTPIAQCRSGIHPQLARVIERLLEPHRENRPESADAVLSLLYDFAAVVHMELPRATGTPQTAFVGRGSELQRSLEFLEGEVRSLEITAPPGGGTTTFMRELQDRVEASGKVVLTAEPGSIAGAPLQEQLYDTVHRMVRKRAQDDGVIEESVDAFSAAKTSAELLDDLLIAARGHRIVLFVDNWRSCDPSECVFLSRLMRQASVRRTNRPFGVPEGDCRVVLGHADDSGRSEHDVTVDAGVHLGPLSSDDIRELSRVVLFDDRLRRSDFKRIAQATGGMPAAVVRVLSALGESGPRSLDQVLREIGQRGLQLASLPDDYHDARFGAPLRAIALWGGELSLTEWEELCAQLGSEADVNERVLSRTESGPATTIRSHHAHAHAAIRAGMSAEEQSRVFAALLAATKGRWRSEDPDRLVPLVRFVGRVGCVPTRAKWATCRAMLLLLEHGRHGDVANAAREVLRCAGHNAPTWAALFYAAAVVEAGQPIPGDCRQHLERSTPRWGLYQSWIRARQLWKARQTDEAYELLAGCVREGSRGLSRSRFMEDYGVLAAEAGKFSESRSASRDIMTLVKRLLNVSNRSVRTLGVCNSDARDHATRRLYRRLRAYRRVRSREQFMRGNYKRAAAAARREALLQRWLGNVAGEALCRNNQGFALIQHGNSRAAVEILLGSVAMREKIDDERGLTIALNNLAHAYTQSGQAASASAILNRATIVAQRNGLTRHRQLAQLNLVLAYACEGQLREASRVARRLIDEAGESGDADVGARALVNYCFLLLDGCHFSLASHWTEEAVARTKDSAIPRIRGYAHHLRAEFEARLGNWVRVRDLVTNWSHLDVDLSADQWDYKALLLAEEGRHATPERIRSMMSERRTLRGRLALLRALCVQCRRNISFHSIRRIVRGPAVHGLVRERMEWVAVFLNQEREFADEEIQWGLEWLTRPELSEGHDDLQVRLRCSLASVLFRKERTREAWRLLQDALRLFERLERKCSRWSGGVPMLDSLERDLQRTIARSGSSSARARSHRSARLKAAAFSSLAEQEGASSQVHTALLDVFAQVRKEDGDRSIIPPLLRAAIEVTGAHRALLIVASDSEAPHILEGAYVGGDKAPPDHPELSWAVVTQVLATGRPAVYRDAVASEELAGHRSVSALHLRSLACVPVLGKERALGALYLDHASVAALFNSEDLRLLAFIAGLVSQALGVEELETQAAESLKALDEAHRHLLRTERNRLAGELASGLAHDLKNLVAAIAARAELLGRKAQDEKTAKSLATIEKAAWTGSTMLERLQECSRVHENTPRQRVELAEIARDAVDLMSYRFAKQGRQDSGGISVDLKIEEEVSVVAVPGELRELFLNLFVNACEAMPDGGDLRVRIGRGGDAQAQIEVSDTGVGIPPDVLKTIFKPFFTTKGSSGTGLGLSVVRGIILRCGGSVTVESDVGSGSTFRVVLPLAGEQVRT